MIALLEDELDLLEETNAARERAASMAGIVFLPEGLTTESLDPDHPNYGMPAIVVGGYTIHGPKEMLDQVKLIKFDSAPIPNFEERKAKLRWQIANLRESLL